MAVANNREIAETIKRVGIYPAVNGEVGQYTYRKYHHDGTYKDLRFVIEKNVFPSYDPIRKTEDREYTSISGIKFTLNHAKTFEMLLLEIQDRFGRVAKMDAIYPVDTISYILVAMYYESTIVE